MTSRARVYRSNGESHWNVAPRRFGTSGSWGEHLLVAAVAVVFLPVALVVLVAMRFVALPLLESRDRRQGRSES